MISVRLFHISGIRLAYVADRAKYDITDSSGKELRTLELGKIATQVRDMINDCIYKKCPGESLKYSEKLINDMAAMHADTWIEGVGLHTIEYSTTKKERPSYQSLDVSEIKSVRSKRYSGDVSGVIGETLFSVVLREYYQMDEYSDYSHLVQPNRMRYPDFAIVNPSQTFKEEMQTQNVLSSYTGVSVPCEVKTFSNFDTSNNLDRIRDAADQLVSFWYSKNQTQGVGVICVPILNATNHSYDLFFVWCN